MHVRNSPEYACNILNLHEKEPMEALPQNDSNPDQAAAPGSGLNPDSMAPAPVLPRKASGLKLWLRDLLISASAAVLIIVFLYQPVRVEGTSMLPRLEDQDRLFINKFVYRFTAIERGDVVVFHYPRDPDKSYIKRVIALPGDHLRIDHGTVWINGQPQPEPYIPEEYRDSVSYPEIVIPADSYFMMGDHRCISSDSRSFGPVERKFIYGKAVFVLWPASDAGTVR
jgi:signal peptidase I